MSYMTRDLLSFALSRNAGESVTLVSKPVKTKNGDGSYTAAPVNTPAVARIVDLQPNERQRLQSEGITLQRGFSISVVGQLDHVPDKILRADGTVIKIIQFTDTENATVMIGDIPTGGHA